MNIPSSKRARRRGTVVALALVLLALPAVGHAATTVGQAVTPTDTCSVTSEYVQTTSPSGVSYVVPSPGVITSMSMMDSASLSGSYDLKVYRHTSGNAYTVVGATGLQAVTPGSGTIIFPTRIPVASGDLLGLALGGTADLCGTSASGAETQSASGDRPPGGTTNTTATSPRQLNVEATLEPDADGDGFGDETQDHCLGLFGSDEGCPKADLSVNNHPSATRVEGGAYVSDILTVRNRGPDPVPDVAVDDAVGSEASVVAVDTTAGTCTLDQTVRCSLGALASGASDIVVVAGRTISIGTLSSEASVSSQALTLAQSRVPGAGDPQPSNNFSTATTEIVSPPFDGLSVAPQTVRVGGRGLAHIAATSERSATGKLVITATVSRVRGTRARTIFLGHASFSIVGGQPETVPFRLSQSARKQLARTGQLKAIVTARARDLFGSSITTTAKVVLKKKHSATRHRPFI